MGGLGIGFRSTLSLKITQKPFIIGSLGPKSLKIMSQNHESFQGLGVRV